MGIDPSTSSTGIAIVNEAGELVHAEKLKGKAECPEDFHRLYMRLDELIQQYKIKEVLYEGQFMGINVKTAIKVVKVCGVVIAVSGKNGIPAEEKKPNSWRKIFHDVFGKVEKGNPKKEDTFRIVKERFGVVTSFKKDNDISDAIGIAFCLYLSKRELGEA